MKSKKTQLIFFLILLAGHNLIAKADPKFSIHLESSDVTSDTITVKFWRNFTYQFNNTESILKIPRSTNNTYNFSLPAICHVGRMFIILNVSTIIEREFLIIEPGDSINIKINKNGEVFFTGRGAEKYSSLRQTKIKLPWKRLQHAKNPNLMQKISDSTITDHLTKISNQKGIKSETKSLLAAESFGEIRTVLVHSIRYAYRDADKSNKKAYATMLYSLKDFDEISDSTILLSKTYIEYLYEKEKLKLILKYGDPHLDRDKAFKLIDLYNHIKANSKGLLRERLITHTVLHSWDLDVFFHGSDADEITYCLKDAVELIKTPYLKKDIAKRLNAIGKGAAAFDFSLLDSAGNMIHLHDFKGKVVFIDIWSNPCGGCAAFKRDFNKYVFPSIKNNRDIVVVSIALNDKLKWQEKIDQFSNRKFINLYTGSQSTDHPISQHYDIIGIPYLLIVDKNGKIFSGSISSSGGGEARGKDILQLINECLKI